MSFILRITTPEGGSYLFDENGLTAFTSKFQAALAVLRALPEIHPGISIRDAKIIGRTLDASPIGTPVTLDETGYIFKIEGVTQQ
jgi:hypothetical protein